ncbi:hypothetical protein OPT61_g733 [Boeremia exigua]|uniref:Uncharacterized protein n=1 Tax=Boeremia exigua TaxID=749465 RepID=A0ACC2ISQ8_9PLEO|nr:hypothetical protein OPT61_g733 [Boeremia exigua]
MAQSILTRKRDLIYFIFFLTHLPVMLVTFAGIANDDGLCVAVTDQITGFDLTGYYPSNIKPLWMGELRAWYVATYGDRFFYNPPAWFGALTFLELVYHVPLTLWAIPALLRNDPRIPLALLVFGMETSITTLVCLAEMWSWEELRPEQRGLSGLGGMYGGYLALGIFMTLDCYARLDQWIARQKGLAPVTKKKL